MKFLVLCFVIGCASAARLDNTYIPPSNAQSAGGRGSFLEQPKQEYLPPHSGAPSNVRNSFSAAPQRNTFTQQQTVNGPGSHQSTFTSVSKGNGFQSVSSGAFSGNGGNYNRPAAPAPAPQQYNGYQQQSSGFKTPASQYPAPGYSGQSSHQASHSSGPLTTPIPILEYENVNNGDGSYKWK